MERDPFEPRGMSAEWKMIYGRLQSMEIDEVITYQELSDLLGRPFQESRAPYYRAKRELERNDSRTLANVSGVGYRVVHPTEHEKLAKGHVRKSHRQLTKAKDQVDSADRGGLTHEDRRRMDALSVHLGSVHAVVQRLNRTVSDHEKRLEKIRKDMQTDRRGTKEDLAHLSAHVDARLDYVTELLARHGITESSEVTQ